MVLLHLHAYGGCGGPGADQGDYHRNSPDPSPPRRDLSRLDSGENLLTRPLLVGTGWARRRTKTLKVLLDLFRVSVHGPVSCH
jgi:hypothetical protein